MSGLLTGRRYRIVPYTREAMLEVSEELHQRFSQGQTCTEDFKVFDKRGRHPEWMDKAEAAVNRVSDIWEVCGLDFPRDAVMETW